MGFWVYVRDIKTGEQLNIHTDQCDFIEKDEKCQSPRFHVGTKCYALVTGLEDMEEDLNGDGYFLTDGSCLTNLKNVSYYDPRQGELYFSDVASPGHKSASVARIHSQTIESMLGAGQVREHKKKHSANRAIVWSPPRTIFEQ